ncbi:hypothetical protein HBI81_156560 [Parastagonospora nodorum]|nr:hypothetical protein HBH51_220220 [Parastagonospora nodorum]KAH4197278.1 hypothetical protein HBI95_189010 [Parastagonospora nodorum]KAH4804356.1 hypothetical protein HBH61_174570 [Parastagonospora nodorum]KAH4895775.1 hypothetical protein HBI80_212340 [Parastagonospora nodorum]KAH4988368.1 hypothetical protein HBI76_087150 [Parastagonospora nodorum]
MTRPARGSIPSFHGPPLTIVTQHHDGTDEHSTLLSRGLILPPKTTSRSSSSSPKKQLRAGKKHRTMASASSSTSLLYACIAHDTTVLAEHTASASSNASSLISMILPLIAKENPPEARRSYDKDNHSVHLLMRKPANAKSPGRLIFLVVAEKAAGKGVPYGFLQTLQDKFFAQFDVDDTAFGDLPSYGCASFNAELKRVMMHQGGTLAGQEDALRTAQREIDGVREIMTENIERVLERGEHMSVLVDKTGRLGENARDFRVRSRTLRRKMWWKNVKLMVLLFVVCLFLIYIFVGFGCGLPAWGRCLRR